MHLGMRLAHTAHTRSCSHFTLICLLAPTELHREVERVIAAGDDELEVRRAVTMTAYLM